MSEKNKQQKHNWTKIWLILRHYDRMYSIRSLCGAVGNHTEEI